jgi:hypothetical protein
MTFECRYSSHGNYLNSIVMEKALITAIMLIILMVIDVVLNARAVDADNDDF